MAGGFAGFTSVIEGSAVDGFDPAAVMSGPLGFCVAEFALDGCPDGVALFTAALLVRLLAFGELAAAVVPLFLAAGMPVPVLTDATAPVAARGAVTGGLSGTDGRRWARISAARK